MAESTKTTEPTFEEKYGVPSSTNRSITTGNSFVMNAGLSPVPSYNFMLRVEGIMDLPCKSIRAFSKEMEYELIQEGGLNDYVHMKRKPISKPFYFEVERYIGVDYIDPLPLGAELLLPVLLLVGRNPNNFAAASRIYTFTGCTVIKKEFGQMDAERSGLFVETTTISYRELVIVDVPWSESYGYNPKDPYSARADSQKAAFTLAKDARTQAEKAATDSMDEFAEIAQERKNKVEAEKTKQKPGQEQTSTDWEKEREEQRLRDEAAAEAASRQAEKNLAADEAAQQARDKQAEVDRTEQTDAEKQAEKNLASGQRMQQDREAKAKADRAEQTAAEEQAAENRKDDEKAQQARDKREETDSKARAAAEKQAEQNLAADKQTQEERKTQAEEDRTDRMAAEKQAEQNRENDQRTQQQRREQEDRDRQMRENEQNDIRNK